MFDLEPSSCKVRDSSLTNSVPKKFPDEKSVPAQVIPSSSAAAIGELVTWSHPSWTVAFPGTLNPVTVTDSPWGSTVEGPYQFAVPAVAIGARIIRSTIAPASLLRSAGMLPRVFRCNMNELVLFYEQTHLAVYSHSVYSISVEPLGGIEPPTFALPRRRYTPKPQWRRSCPSIGPI